MLKAYLSVIHASLILADTCGYHAHLSTVASYIDMISVIFIRGKSLKLHAPVSIHATSISADSITLLLVPFSAQLVLTRMYLSEFILWLKNSSLL